MKIFDILDILIVKTEVTKTMIIVNSNQLIKIFQTKRTQKQSY